MKDMINALKANVVFLVGTGLIFPVVIWGISQVLFPHQANGSLIRNKSGAIAGSELIGQSFVSPKYFHPRPSAAGSGYDAANSSGTNLGPTSKKLFDGIADDPVTTDVDESYSGVVDLANDYRRENGLKQDSLVPVDAVTRSASGLDPDISPANALLQARRIAEARGMPVDKVESLVRGNVQPRYLGIFGEPRVNVLRLNRALDSIGTE